MINQTKTWWACARIERKHVALLAAALASDQCTWQTYWWWHLKRALHIMIQIIGVFSLIIGGPLILYKREYKHAIKVQSLRSLPTTESARGRLERKEYRWDSPWDNYAALSHVPLHNCTPAWYFMQRVWARRWSRCTNSSCVGRSSSGVSSLSGGLNDDPVAHLISCSRRHWVSIPETQRCICETFRK